MTIRDDVIEFLKKNKNRWFTISELSRKINRSYPHVLRVVNELIEEGLIVEDRKNQNLRLIKWKS